MSCNFDVVILDVEDPTLSCPSTITQNTDPGLCTATVAYEVTADDNCGIDTSIQNSVSGIGLINNTGTGKHTFVTLVFIGYCSC